MSKATLRDMESIKETNHAVLVTDGVGFEEWIPKSQIHDDSEIYKDGQTGDLVIQSWFAEKLGVELD